MVTQLAENDTSDIGLVPYSGIQFLTYAFNIEQVTRFSRSYIWREKPCAGSSENVELILLPESDQVDDDGLPVATPVGSYRIIDVTKTKALEPFIDQWIPVPFFRTSEGDRGQILFGAGPSNWSRVRVTRLNGNPNKEETDAAQNQSKYTHCAVFAFDTELLPTLDGPYLAPSESDAQDRQVFRLATRIADVGHLLAVPEVQRDGTFLERDAWVTRWIEEAYLNHLKREAAAAKRSVRTDENFPLEAASRYLAFLSLLDAAIQLPSIYFIDTVSETSNVRPVNVDFVLDVGNSRTCGILIEQTGSDEKLSNAHKLQLRILSEPHLVSEEPFESHVELAHADFGPEPLSRLSGSGSRFFWPSPVRVGPEVARMRASAVGNELASGISSPKRYLWDFEPVLQEWWLMKSSYYREMAPPNIELALRKFVNARGDVLREVDSESAFYRSFPVRTGKIELNKRARRMTFCRSSFFTFMLAELILHAMAQINSPSFRRKSREQERPRQLRRVILTVPTTMPIREQRIMRSRANAAVKLLEEIAKYGRGGDAKGFDLPRVEIGWDEATCAQFVYLYNEVSHKFGGNVSNFVSLMGRPRVRAWPDRPLDAERAEEPSIRIASVDVGGGTTDLMITTYYVDDDIELKPVQVFREGFRLAGDDILQAVIQRAVLPSLQQGLAAAGLASAHEFVLERFGGDRPGMSQQEKHLRKQFVLQVLQPIALHILREYESANLAGSESGNSESLVSMLEKGHVPRIDDRIRAYVEEPARAAGAREFRLEEVEFELDFRRIRDAIMAVLMPVFDNIAEAIHHFDPDIVLLTGRPSRLPATMDLLVDKLAVPPGRTIPMHKYPVGLWYPFRDASNRYISDPKTTAVVGAMLCTFAKTHGITNLSIDMAGLQLKSTAKYLGRLEGSGGRILEKNVFFAHDESRDQTAEVRYRAPIFIGARQLPYERWIASPLYRLQLEGGEQTENLRLQLPIMVTLRRQKPDEDIGDAEEFNHSVVLKHLRDEAMHEELIMEDAMTESGISARRSMHLSFVTMLNPEGGYWLDTGILEY